MNVLFMFNKISVAIKGRSEIRSRKERRWSWGEYHNAKWRTVKHFCSQCFAEEVRKPLLEHTGDCGCTINLVVREAPQPEWLTLKTCEQVGAK